MTASPITTAYLDLSPDIRARAEEIAGNNRPVSWPEVLLLVGTAIAGERERCLEAVRRAPAFDENGYITEKGAVMNEIIRGDETEREPME
ncbi:hypothetical protein CN067_27715 [Sinorhizobium meliloti]|uniref:hypothetical protein n=1 Tax=Rhizobium meliloti TaxID=382 RepID=UPI000FD7212A|nr:hypothetical protein [Sinorhizobium meliloti]RVQ13925.1 hypothetical protein CN067_27715 [Sinorhizobium meliloti]